jgi:GMP synthase (glutamine-hydrolysing)
LGASLDIEAADLHPSDIKFLGVVATDIVNAVKGVSRVVCDVTPEPWIGRE